LKRGYKSPLNPPSEDVGKPSITILWQTFVRVVLEVTVEAYQMMRQKRGTRREWEEDTFTLNLFKHLLPLASRHPIGLNVKPQVLVFTPEMEAGEVSIKEAKKIDIQLWLGSWENHDRIYFAWEAKLIADRNMLEPYQHLIAEYVTNGIVDRFIDGKYSSEVNDAGMLGYILIGHANIIVDQINRSMWSSQRIRKLSEEDYLIKSNPIGGFADVYSSCHKRVFCDRPICLYHMFLTFDYIQ
jgi:hypothetical protein